MAAGNFGERIAVYGAWRGELVNAVRRYGQWLDDAGLADPALGSRIAAVVERLREDRISIAFVAEFSRGKSELINAIFFSGYGQRVLPSSAGRTTMCPTELLHDPARPPSIRLLPIESRLRETPLGELRARSGEWHEIPIRPGDADSVAGAFASVRDTRRVPVEQAAALGLYRPDDEESPVQPDAAGLVEIPRWRHAIVNIPDPLLETGLVVIDTPGLNAIGNEPELTLSLIPGADAVLFVLAADAGVTRSDIAVWREHVEPAHRNGRFVVLNKIDGLWDELRDERQVDAEIGAQVASVARTLELPESRVFPVSAQKGLVAKIHRDPALLRRSRLPDLERALSHELVPQRHALVRERVGRDFDEVSAVVASVLGARRRNLVEQLFELNGLRGKNRGVVDHMAARIRAERTDFEKSLRHLQALRTVFSRHSQAIYAAIAVEALRRHVRSAREVMRASNFSVGLREGMTSLTSAVRSDFESVSRLVDEISTLMNAMYRSFNAEHGLTLGTPMLFSMRRYFDELDRIEALHRRQFGALTLVTTEKWVLMRRFFESVAARIKEVYDVANRDVEAWLRAVIAPIEGQVREHQLQLRRRLDSVDRVREASDSLDERIAEIEFLRARIEEQLALASEHAEQVRAVLDAPLPAAPGVDLRDAVAV
ncbi:MAG TPA: dynamin family protein [Quisquiliibacterium sp.]|nr:dynamin family protein [Quisquiliibacterium sp.]